MHASSHLNVTMDDHPGNRVWYSSFAQPAYGRRFFLLITAEETFREEERLRLSNRNSILMTQICSESGQKS